MTTRRCELVHLRDDTVDRYVNPEHVVMLTSLEHKTEIRLANGDTVTLIESVTKVAAALGFELKY